MSAILVLIPSSCILTAIAVLVVRYVLIEKLWVDIAILSLTRYLREIKQHIPKGALVLDVGSGDRPYLRADVVCDRYEQSWERTAPLLRDRPLVIGDVYALPFKQKAFDIVICQHLVEHLLKPEEAFSELSRVASGGLIRTPSPLAEKLVSRDVHRWFVAMDNHVLSLTQKNRANFDDELTTVLAGDHAFWRFFGQSIARMETTLWWKEAIHFKVERIATPDWDGVASLAPGEGETNLHINKVKRGSRAHLRQIMTRWISRIMGAPAIDKWDAARWESLLACPACRGNVIVRDTINCCSCGLRFPFRQQTPVMLIEEALPAVTVPANQLPRVTSES